MVVKSCALEQLSKNKTDEISQLYMKHTNKIAKLAVSHERTNVEVFKE